jgi:hypothetical protein
MAQDTSAAGNCLSRNLAKRMRLSFNRSSLTIGNQSSVATVDRQQMLG